MGGLNNTLPGVPTPDSGFGALGEVLAANGANIDLWPGAPGIGTQPEPVTAGFTPNILSSSVNDTVGGAGVSEVGFNYLDTAGARQTGSFTMNGQSQVNHSSITDCMFINEIFAITLDGALVAAGNIDIRNSTTVMSRMNFCCLICSGVVLALGGGVKYF